MLKDIQTSISIIRLIVQHEKIKSLDCRKCSVEGGIFLVISCSR